VVLWANRLPHMKREPSPLEGEGREGGSAAANARRLRAHMTDAERKLWWLLRRKQLQGFRFRRQVPIGPYIADFACHSARLIVELDGGQHTVQTVYDDRRTRWLGNAGYRVLRFWNAEVFTNSDGVLETIRLALLDPPPQPSPSRGEGD
jgi:very-short-patch-repair endonuclease